MLSFVNKCFSICFLSFLTYFPGITSISLTPCLFWRQTVQSLTIDGKALPSTAIWGQDDNNSDRLARAPDAWIDPTQPMVKKFSISKEVIAEQAGRVRTLRKELSRLHQELKHLENDKVRDDLGLPKVGVHDEGEVMIIDD